MKEKIAIIGGGIAGLSAGYFLKDKYDIMLFEKTDRVGGNAYTIPVKSGERVDIAVAAFGIAGYDNFYKLLKELKVKTSWAITSYMSLHNLDTKKGLYLTPLSLKGLIAQKFDLLRPSHFFNFIGLLRGIKKMIKRYDKGELKNKTFGEAVADVPQFQKRESYLVLMSALCLMSSMYAKEVLEAPAEFFVGKLKKHNDVISPKSIYSVRCMKNKTESYIKALANTFIDNIHLNANIKTIKRDKNGVTLICGAHGASKQKEMKFDHVILACNADQALKLLDKPTKDEKRLLGKWKYKISNMVVHRDHSSFPKPELIQAFNFLYTDKDGEFHTSVSGGLRHEGGVSNKCDLISTQHANFPIDDKLVEFKTNLRTPIYTKESFETQKELPSLNGVQNTYFCGSHFGHGLHEAAITSSVNVAKMLGVDW